MDRSQECESVILVPPLQFKEGFFVLTHTASFTPCSNLSTYLTTGLLTWYRYVDDTFVVLHSDENDKFFRHINAVDLNIQFTQVNISDNRLSFLDCLLTIDTDRT